jgi:hypothetical protein
VWSDVLSECLLSAVTSECQKYGKTAKKEAINEKIPIESMITRWMDATATPRCAVELAIQQLRHLVVPPEESGACTSRVSDDNGSGSSSGGRRFVGAEWWVQRRAVTNSLDFHFDIDSCMMHSKKIMRSPDISSIFYLSDVGGPTVVLDQRLGEGMLWGHRLLPANATCTHLIFPTPNQYAIFPGACLHGVMPDILASDSADGNSDVIGEVDQRMTLLVNWWWEDRPLEPCYANVNDEMAERLARAHNSPLSELISSSPSVIHEDPMMDLNLQSTATPVHAVDGYLSLGGSQVPYDFYIPDESSVTWMQRKNTRVLELDHVRRIKTALDA